MFPVFLVILDGWGLGKKEKTNAFESAKAPFLKSLFSKYPFSTLSASGEDVGLPEGQMGNSEVGHLNIGAGRIVYQDLTRITKDIRDGVFGNNLVFNKTFDSVRENRSRLHLMGLVSDGGVHSHIDHLKALVRCARAKGVSDVVVHCFTDGRDTAPDSGVGFITELDRFLNESKTGRIGLVSGRYYAMDRDKRWERTVDAYNALTLGTAAYQAEDAVAAVRNAYQRGETDEFIKPTVIGLAQNMVIRDKDVVIFFNFRADRARQLTWALTDPAFNGFERKKRPQISQYVTMTLYDENFKNVQVAYPPVVMKNILSEVLSGKKIRQLRIAETEKYAHVTYFFNGGEETPFPLEDRCLIPSPKDVATYDLKPAMSAVEVTDTVIKKVKTGEYDFIVINYANLDMVGHTGKLDAAVAACETVDACVARLVPEVMAKGGTVFLTSDHGNAEKMTEPGGAPHTAHTTNRVPFIFITNDSRLTLRNGILADIAPTILSYIGIKKPSEMSGESLFNAD